MLDPTPSILHRPSPAGGVAAADSRARTRSGAAAAKEAGLATIEEWLAIPEERRAELIDGRIVYHAFPGPKHGFSQLRLGARLDIYNRRTGHGSPGSAPGGWWISQEVDMQIGSIGCRPDVVGWRRSKHARCPEPDGRGVCTEIPEFVCEVLSKSTARYDQGDKREAYLRAGVEHYWLVDPMNLTLTVLTRTNLGYLVTLSGGRGDVVRAPPFEKAKIVVADLFLDEDDDVLPPEPEAPSPQKRRPKPGAIAKKPGAARPRRR